MCPSLLTLTSSALFELAEVLNHSDTFTHSAEDSIVQEVHSVQKLKKSSKMVLEPEISIFAIYSVY